MTEVAGNEGETMGGGRRLAAAALGALPLTWTTAGACAAPTAQPPTACVIAFDAEASPGLRPAARSGNLWTNGEDGFDPST